MATVVLIKYAVVLLLGLITASFIIGPGLEMNPKSIKLNEKPKFLGPLSSNNLLDSAQRLFEGTIGHGPESIAIKENVLYTGVVEGHIQQIQGEQLKTLTRIGGPNCKILDSEPGGCGRPLGMRLNRKGDELIVADPKRGLYSVFTETGEIRTLVSSSTLVDGKPIGFANDLAIASNGDIYFTDSTYKWGFKYILLEAAENAGNGRLLHYDAENRTVTSLVSNIHCANGVELPPEEDYVLFAETLKPNILKYHLKGPKTGQVETFHENLPGMPDNIRRSPRGTYWVAMAGVRLPYEDSLYEQLSEYPLTRRVLYSTVFFLLQLVDNIKAKVSNPVLEFIYEWMNHWFWTSCFGNLDYGLILELNSEGEIIRSFHSPKGVLNKISQVTEHENTLYIASFENAFIGKVSLNGQS